MAEAREQTRHRMLSTALSLFTEHGYEGASIGMIASSMGLSKAAVSYHFRTKEDILAVGVEPALVDLQAFVQEIGAEPVKPARRRQAIAEYVRLMVKHRAILSFLARERLAPSSPSIAGRWADTVQQLEWIFGSGDRSPAARIYMRAAVRGLAMALTGFPGLSDDDLRDHLNTAAERMLKHPHRSAR
jgi:AcrR family transcriptional regulator